MYLLAFLMGNQTDFFDVFPIPILTNDEHIMDTPIGTLTWSMLKEMSMLLQIFMEFFSKKTRE
jgi:hypothetical protein